MGKLSYTLTSKGEKKKKRNKTKQKEKKGKKRKGGKEKLKKENGGLERQSDLLKGQKQITGTVCCPNRSPRLRWVVKRGPRTAF